MSTCLGARDLFDSEPDLAAIAHDIRNPLSIILMFLQLNDVSDAGDENVRKLHVASLHAIERITRLVEQLRRSEKERGPEFTDCDLVPIIRATLEEAASLGKDRTVEIRYVGPERLNALLDGGLVGRALTNLVVNAVQASTAGNEVRLALFVRDGTLFVEIADNGCGIDDAHLSKIFERGFTHGKADGTGIGLDVCKKVAEGHGGTIAVHSRKGVGTAFVFSLPRATFSDFELGDAAGPKALIADHAGYALRERPAATTHMALREDTLD